jgi:hypothetical protein
MCDDTGISRLRRDSGLLREFGELQKETRRDRILELKKTNETLKSLVIEKKSGGQRLTQAAALLLLAPDPITDAAAVPVLVAAQVMKMKSKKQSDLQRVLEGAHRSMSDLSSLADLL